MLRWRKKQLEVTGKGKEPAGTVANSKKQCAMRLLRLGAGSVRKMAMQAHGSWARRDMGLLGLLFMVCCLGFKKKGYNGLTWANKNGPNWASKWTSSLDLNGLRPDKRK